MGRDGVRGRRAGARSPHRPGRPASRRRLHASSSAARSASVIIPISRLFGSGGSDVAARVAKELHWSLLDNAVVDSVAERLGVSAAEVSSMEDRVPSLVERIATALTMSAPEISPTVDDSSLMVTAETRIVDVTKRVMEEAVAQG